jgi:hypothetical protein
MHCVFALFGFDQGTKSIQTVFIKMRLVGNFPSLLYLYSFSIVKLLVSQLKFH